MSTTIEETTTSRSPVSVPEIGAVEVERPTVKDVLVRAADLLEEFGWCQFHPALDADGWSCQPCDSWAMSFCLTGSVERALFDLSGHNPREEGWPAWFRLSTRPKRKGQKPLLTPEWNNAAERTKAEVVARLREAAERSAT
jgi:hypothetical protein